MPRVYLKCPPKRGMENAMQKTLRIGIIGCGGIARWAHAPYYKDEKRVKIVAVCDILPDRVKQFRDDLFPKAEVCTDYRELLKRKDVDAVDICTPNDLHSEIAVAAFKAKKHVFCEKPDAVSPEKALAMKEASEKAGKLLMVMRPHPRRVVVVARRPNGVFVFLHRFWPPHQRTIHSSRRRSGAA